MLKVNGRERMRTALLLGKDSIQVQSTQQPEIGPGDVLLRTKASLICGTDVRILRYGHAAISSGTRRILGHELSGVIARVGSDVSSLKTGMRVAVAPNMGCGLCDQCVSGNMHLCADYRALGIHIDGGFAEYVRIPSVAVRQGNVIDIPPQMSFVEAALAEPLSCVYNGFERCALRPGDTVLVMGAGPIGLMHAKMAKLGGASTVFVSDLNSERLLRCRHIDASLVALDANDIEGKIMDFTSARGVDVCITACPSAEAQQQSLQLTAVNGRVLFFGGLPTNASEVHLDTNLIHYKQLMVTGTTRASMRQFRTVLSLVGRGTLTVKEFITETFDIAEIRQAFAYTAQGLGLRCMIAFDGHAK